MGLLLSRATEAETEYFSSVFLVHWMLGAPRFRELRLALKATIRGSE